MTIASVNQKKRYTGNDSTTVFPYDFKVNDEEHLVVTIADADDDQTELALNTDYTVSGVGEDAGGNVTVGDLTAYCEQATLPTGWSITINREPPLLQLTDLANQGPFAAETHEAVFDYLTMCILYLEEKLDRCLKVTITSGETGASLDEDFSQILSDCQDARDASQGYSLTSAASASESSLSATAANASATAASGHATTALGYANTASGFADDAADSADEAIAARDSVVVSVHEETAGAAQNTIDISGSFTALDMDKGNVQIYIDGLRLATSEWTRTSDTLITLGSALSGGEVVEVYSATASSGGSASVAAHEAAYDHTQLHTHGNFALLETYTQTDVALAGAVTNSHTHTNKTYIDKIGESGGVMTYNGSPITGTANLDEINGVLAGVAWNAEIGLVKDASGWIDTLDDETGIDASSSTNEVFTTGHYAPTGGYTSDVTSSGTASAQSTYNLNYASNATDDNNNTMWGSNGSGSQWWKLDFGSGVTKTIAQYTIRAKWADIGYAPKNFTFEGSNDGSSWTTLDTQTNQSWTISEQKTYSISNKTAYRYYRILITQNQSGATDYFQIAEIEMMELNPPSNMTLISNAYEAAANDPDNVVVFALVKDNEAVTIDTDFTMDFSMDDGSNYESLSGEVLYDTGTYLICKFSKDGLTAQTDASCRYRFKSLNNKDLEVHGIRVVLEWN